MANPPWNEMYESGDAMPWDAGVPEPMLIEMLASGALGAGRALDVGCGTGTNAIYLAQHGFEVLGIDLAPRAVERATAKANGAARFMATDFLAAPPEGQFDLVFDRGCFHCFDAPEQRAQFAANVARLLAPKGRWLSLVGSTDGPPRQSGPPRRSALDITTALEPVLEIVSLRAAEFDVESHPARAWIVLATKRATY